MLRLSFLIALGTALSTTAAFASDLKTNEAASLPQVKSIQLGFGNHYKLGCWTPVAVTLSTTSNDSGATAQQRTPRRIDVQAADGDGVPAWFVGPEIAPTGSAFYESYIRIGRANQPIRVGISADSSMRPVSPATLSSVAVERSAIALPATSQFIVELGASIGLPEIVRRQNPIEAERTTVVTIDAPQILPDKWYGYDGVDMVVIVADSAVKQSLISPAALEGLEHWVRQGGELFVCCGNAAEQIFGKGGPLARLAPGELVGVVNLPAARFGSIENFAGAEQRLDATSIRVPQWKISGSDHHIELSGGTRADDLPLIVRWPVGFGQVTFVGLDLDRVPFAGWPSRGKFLEKLLERHTSIGGRVDGSRSVGPRNRLGYIDLAGQLHGALDQSEGVLLIPFWAVAALALAYIGMLFPLSYWIVTRCSRRQTLAWVVFPVTIIVFCMAAYALAGFTKGTARHVNQVDLTDADLSTGSMRGATWLNIYSPDNALYDLHVQSPTDNVIRAAAPTGSTAETRQTSSMLFSWFGLPGTGLGGMNSAAANRPLFDEPYTIDPARGSIFGAPLAKWSSQSFVARWETGDRTLNPGGLEAAIVATPDRRLRGSMVSRLPATLTDCVLLFDRWAYPLGTLTPGNPVNLDRVESQTIDTYLTKRRTIDAHDEVQPYDRAGLDVPRIIEVMMFYEAAGGANYAGLLNRYQRFTDLTVQLEFGRAILVGRGPAGATVQVDGQPPAEEATGQHISLYRFVIPLQTPGGT